MCECGLFGVGGLDFGVFEEAYADLFALVEGGVCFFLFKNEEDANNE